MSNKIVPSIYRAVIDDVINAIKPEFDEYGVPEDVLAELQHKWENKVIASHVAEFESPQPPAVPPSATHPSLTAAAQPLHHAYPTHPMHMMPPHYPQPHNPYAPMASVAPPTQPIVKTEPVDNRYMLNPGGNYTLPPLTTPTLNGNRQLPPPAAALPNPGGQTGVLNFPRNGQSQPAASSARPYAPPAQNTTSHQTQRIPQVDGPSESSGDEDSPSPPPSGAFAPRTPHPSLPQPAPPARPPVHDSEAINSDLDDSDSEGSDSDEEGAAGDSDIVFCTYDKVARVKNKWKCILKDGMIHINGKDYLFAKCTGEFEW
ncbi:transcription factor IIA, alpha/beta subunit [Gymnopilus junonius]|uniref:Transcription factor IIA, alpha/beta subunit n=1 Tax=Gymnopilus junonius TaxID=109634 RepID=A0A9P5NQH8_GYMJU|nr:transcription factor IIA, alpha/beta subunit [Gymnopilus junonius]